MKQKLIFLDIDGTLLPPGEMIVPESAVDAIHRARARSEERRVGKECRTTWAPYQ